MATEHDHRYEPHSDIEYEGFQITDASINSGESIWVGRDMAGRWMTAAQVKELAALLNRVALEHEARTKQD